MNIKLDSIFIRRNYFTHFQKNVLIAYFILSLLILASWGIFLKPSILNLLKGVVLVLLIPDIFRELDPDFSSGLFLTPLFLAPAFYFTLELSIIPSLWMLLCLRFLVRGNGLKPSIVDSIILFLISLFLGLVFNIIYCILGALVFLGDMSLKKKAPLSFFLGAILLIFGGTFFINMYVPKSQTINLPLVGLSVGGIAIFLPRFSGLKNVFSLDDLQKSFLSPRRIRLSQIFSIVFGFYLLLSGISSSYIFIFAPLGASSLYYFYQIKKS